MTVSRRRPSIFTCVLIVSVLGAVLAAQRGVPAPPTFAAVHPIAAPATPLPSEAASAGVTRFSFIAYGDTRSSGILGEPGDGDRIHPEHSRLMDLMLASVKERASSTFPIRFVLQSGDAVVRGQDAEGWNVSFSPIIERLDRARYRHVIVFMHHPPFSSGPHGGASADPMPGTGDKAPDQLEPSTVAIRNLYMPLFRKHRVRMLLTGHDHLLDHFVERYTDAGVNYRMDAVVTGGGGAPIYRYVGEPDLRTYTALNAAQNVRVEHLMKPGPTVEDNPLHFLVVQVDGDRLSLEVVGIGPRVYAPYGGRARITLDDR